MSSRLALALLTSAPLVPSGPKTVPPELFPPQQLKQDFRIARGALEEGHPGIYRYVTKEALDHQFDEAAKKLDHPMDVYGFWAILAPAVARIECGHTHLDLPESAMDALNKSAPLLPLQVKLIGQKVYVFRDYTSEHQALAGGEILSINGMPIEKIVAALSRVEPEDGEIPTSRLRHVGRHFIVGLYVLLGMRAPYTVTYREAREGPEKRVILPGLVPSRLMELSKARYPQDDQPADHSADLRFVDDGKIAVMAIHWFIGFADREKKKPMSDFINESFALLQQKGTKALILDLRNNGGGEDGLGKLLFSHLTDHPFYYYKDLIINALHFGFMRYADAGPEAVEEHYGRIVQGMPVGRYRITVHPNLGLQQPQEPVFRGKVFIVMNGGSFSTTCEFISIARFHRRAVFIGEESGGGCYGNTSGGMPVLTLPHTRLTLRLPLVKYVMAVSGYRYPRRGVFPDYPVRRTITDWLTGRDPEMTLALALARKANGASVQSDPSAVR